MPNETILVVDDEQDIRKLLEYNLGKNGYRTICVASGEDALRSTREELPDLVILDLMLPSTDGLEVCRQLKADSRTANIPVIMLTAKGEEADVVAGLELGADDYVTKPFSPRVLLARVRTVLRRPRVEPEDETAMLRVRELTITPGRHEVLVDGKRVDLTRTEFRILHLLARRPGWVFTRQQIINIAREDAPVTDRSVDVHIVGLRKKIRPYEEYIETIRGVGYRFKE
jgi:two-component system phosphate regulon response regulator PhoB